jgi:hypothetical protein
MRRVQPRTLVLILTGAVLLLMLFGGGAGVVSFLLLRAGYGFPVWGLVPFLTLLLIALILGAVLWWAAGGTLPSSGRQAGPQEGPRGNSPSRGPSRGGPRRGDDV